MYCLGVRKNFLLVLEIIGEFFFSWLGISVDYLLEELEI